MSSDALEGMGRMPELAPVDDTDEGVLDEAPEVDDGDEEGDHPDDEPAMTDQGAPTHG